MKEFFYKTKALNSESKIHSKYMPKLFKPIKLLMHICLEKIIIK